MGPDGDVGAFLMSNELASATACLEENEFVEMLRVAA